MTARNHAPVTLRSTALLCAALASSTFASAARAAPTSPADEDQPAPLTDAMAVDQATSELVEHHRHHHHGGIAKFVAMSLDTLGVAPEKQPRVEQIQTDLYACMIPARDLENGLLLTLADGAAAGQVDVPKADAAIGQLEAAATAVHACAFGPLNRLHAALSRNQRATLVDKVQAHWRVWRQANLAAETGNHDKGSRLSDLATELSLTPDQIDKASSALQTALGATVVAAVSSEQKAAVARAVEEHAVPLLTEGRVTVPVAARIPMAEATAGYDLFASGGKFGKIVLINA